MKASAAVYFQLVGAKIAGVKIIKSARELVQTTTISWTVGGNLEYGFYISQDVPNKASATGNQVVYVGVSFAGTPTNAQVGAALVAQIEAFAAAGKLKVSAAYSSGASFNIVADAGYPLFTVSAPLNVAQASGMATVSPSGTPALAIVDIVAPHATPATAIAGGATVTVTTAAAHGLLPGDVVDISSAATFLMNDVRTGGSGLAAVSDVVIATAPTSTTFTLQGITGNSGSNSGTIVIRVKNKVRVVTSGAHLLSVGDKVTVSGIATFTVNGLSSVTSRVESASVSTSFWINGAGNSSASNANTGTIVITRVAQEAAGIGANLSALGVKDTFAATPVPALDAITAASYYTEVVIDYVSAKGVNGLSLPALGEQAEKVKLYVEESATDYAGAIFRIGQVAQGLGWNSYYSDPSL
jgi:hypothetical protein